MYDERLAQFLDPAYVYRFTHGPDMVTTKEQALREGINCVSLAHFVVRELCDVRLPAKLMCSELHQDDQYF